MYLLTCPHCEATHEVSAAKAGGEMECSGCHEAITVPKLGELRNLPQSDAGNDPAATAAASSLSGGRSIAFAALGLVCLLSALAALFCGVNWYTVDVPVTTEGHIEMFAEYYEQASSAQMIREFEDITEYGVDIPAPLEYRVIELRREAWGQKTIGFAAIAIGAFVLALLVARRGRSRPTATSTAAAI